MRKRNLCFKLLIGLIFFLSFTKIGYSQPDYNKSYELSLTNLTLLDLTFIYTKKINDLKYLEITNSFVYHKNKEHNNGNVLFLTIQDPYKLYNLYRFRIGIRRYNANNNYTCPMFIFNFGGYNNGLIKKYIDDKGSDATDVDYLLNRLRFDVGAILKFGHLKTYDNNFLTDIYGGFGFKVKFFDDYILEKRSWGGGAMNDYPIQERYVKLMPTFHFGILFGYKK